MVHRSALVELARFWRHSGALAQPTTLRLMPVRMRLLMVVVGFVWLAGAAAVVGATHPFASSSTTRRAVSNVDSATALWRARASRAAKSQSSTTPAVRRSRRFIVSAAGIRCARRRRATTCRAGSSRVGVGQRSSSERPRPTPIPASTDAPLGHPASGAARSCRAAAS